MPSALLVLSCTCTRVLYTTHEESSKKANASELHNRIMGLFMRGSLSEASTPHHVSTRHSTISGKPNRDLMYSKIKTPHPCQVYVLALVGKNRQNEHHLKSVINECSPDNLVSEHNLSLQPNYSCKFACTSPDRAIWIPKRHLCTLGVYPK